MMNALEEEIKQIVKRHNETGEPIYQKKIIALLKGKASPVTIMKKISFLVEDKKLIQIGIYEGRGYTRFLFIPGYEPQEMIENLDDKLDAILRNQRTILERLPNEHRPYVTKEDGMNAKVETK